MIPGMTEVRWTDHAGDLLTSAGDFLRSRPAEHSVILTNAARRIADDADNLWGWVVSPEGTVIAAAIHTPPFGAYVSLGPDTAIAALSRGFHERGRALPGVGGLRQQVEVFAADWAGRTGAEVETQMRQGVYVADAVTPPTGVPGRLRRAGSDDKELLSEWVDAFHADTGLPGEPERELEDRIESGRLFVWIVDERPVSMTGATPPAADVSRVQYVYTPVDQRGHGYASACVAAVTARELAEPRRTCVLYTDLANPTSNGIYQAVGYRLLGEAVQLGFG
jgi:predicted GNAT family acetyltransferase